MNLLFRSVLLRLLSLSLALGYSSAYATLIGDTITVSSYYPAIGTHVGTSPVNTVVQAGSADAVVWTASSIINNQQFSGLNPWVVNPEANSLIISNDPSLALTIQTFASSAFNGLVVTGIDATITGFSVSTSIPGFSNSRVSFDAHSVSVNFAGVSWIGSNTPGLTPSSFVLNLTFAPTAAPDGGATAVMLGFAVLSLAALRWRVA